MAVTHTLDLTGVVPGLFEVTIPVRDKNGQTTAKTEKLCLTLDVCVDDTVRLWEISERLRSYVGLGTKRLMEIEGEVRGTFLDFIDFVDRFVVPNRSSDMVKPGWLRKHLNMAQAAQLAVSVERLLDGMQGYNREFPLALRAVGEAAPPAARTRTKKK